MKKKNNTKNTIAIRSIIFITILALILIFVYINFGSSSSPTSNSTQQTKQFQSKNMHFSIQINSDFQTKDNDSSVTLTSPDGQIAILRNGTNFKDLDDYISNFDSKRKLVSSNSNKFTIDGHEALTRMVEFPEENIQQKSYYIYVNNFVYILSTSSPALYNNLDQIAQSFQYNP